MNYKKVLDKLPNMYIVITDKQDRIVYPKNKKKLKLIEKIYKGYKKEKGYCEYKDNYYEIIKEEHIRRNKRYNIMYLKNITKLINLQNKYETDELTTVLNRNVALNKIDEFILQNRTNFSIVMGDIDDFKLINDTYGHIVGDIVLNRIGKLLKDELNDCLIGRYGGEEFIILMPNTSDSFNRIDTIRRLISEMSVEYNNGVIDNISMSFGICNISEKKNNNDIKKLRNRYIDNADTALYKSKSNNKNQVTVY